MVSKRLCPLGKVVALDQQRVPNLLARSLCEDLPGQTSGDVIAWPEGQGKKRAWMIRLKSASLGIVPLIS